MTPTIHFTTVVGGDDIRLLSRLIDHYKFLGVNGRWLLGVHIDSSDSPILGHATGIVRQHGIDAAVVPVIGPWRHRVNPGVLGRMRSLYPRDWAVIADQDEFHVYPDALTAIVRYCESHSYEAVQGDLIDRLGPRGTLPAIEPGKSLWMTFPLGGDVTNGLLPWPSPQVVLAKGSVVLGWGSHSVHRGIACPRTELSVPVHHFKWDASVIDRLDRRFQHFNRLGELYADQTMTFLTHIMEHGRIDIEDPRLRVRYLGNPYGGENMLDDARPPGP